VTDDDMPMREVDVMPGMVIRPGDVLVVSCTEPLEQDRVQRLRTALLERMPGLADVIVLVAPLSVAAVYRDGVPDDADPLGRGEH
jgi:hypothetical protein